MLSKGDFPTSGQFHQLLDKPGVSDSFESSDHVGGCGPAAENTKGSLVIRVASIRTV